MLIYDLEILKAIPDRRNPRLDGIEYCDGWDDHSAMGISCVCVYDAKHDRYRVFLQDNLAELFELMSDPLNWPLVSFNGLAFDNQVLQHAGMMPDNLPSDVIEQQRRQMYYDILVQVWQPAGLGPRFVYPSHTGYGLDAICEANNPTYRKTGNGALAPVLWQQGRHGEVIDYCLNDVRMTKFLLDLILRGEPIRNPKNNLWLQVEPPR